MESNKNNNNEDVPAYSGDSEDQDIVDEPSDDNNNKADEIADEEDVEEESNDSLGKPRAGDDDAAVEKKHYNIFERQSMHVARHPCIYFWVAFITSWAVGILAMIVGEFSVSADNAGWNSRGTQIADRHTQYMLVEEFAPELHADTTDEVWLNLINNVQPGWETDDDEVDRRQLAAATTIPTSPSSSIEKVGLEDIAELGHRFQRALQMQPMRALQEAHAYLQGDDDDNNNKRHLAHRASLLPRLSPEQIRLLQTLNNTEGTLLEGCDTSWYTSATMYEDTRLWPVWRTRNSAQDSFFDADLVQELCEEEQTTQRVLQDQNLCLTCNDGQKCLQPYSTVFYARLTVTNGMTLSCADLGQAWKNEGHEEAHKTLLQQCVADLLATYSLDRDGTNMPDSCPFGFFPSILDEFYPNTQRAEFSSTIFASKYDAAEDMYDSVDSFPRGQANIKGAYDTQYEDFVELSLDEQLLIDMSLAVGSAFVTCIAMMVHTRSPFLTLVGLAQIVLSFPLAFFFYTFVAQLEFFPFLNFIGIFVIFALGADDVFVAVDKWKNARLKNPDATVEEVAAIALPDAAMAMLLTTLTTAVAFFGTAVCPVAPILCFAVFCGLLVVLDYIMCVLLVFPALCIYDQADKENRCCCHCKCRCIGRCCKKEEGERIAANKANTDGDDEAPSNDEGEIVRADSTLSHYDAEMEEGLIHRILRGFYKYLHLVRWPLLLVCAGALVWCAVVAAQIELPTSSDVRLYDESDNQYEQNFVWRKNLLFDVLEQKGGSQAHVVWGVTPADTGNLNNPEEWSQLVLDNSFDPSVTEAQVYLKDYCERFFAQDFASEVSENFTCPMNAFESWLVEQSTSTTPSATYTEHCNGATGIPMPQENFDACMYNWGQQVRELRVLARQGKITVMYFSFNSRVRYDSPYDDLDSEWHLIEGWMGKDRAENAPPSARNSFFTSEDFWWYDTNGSMLDTAFKSAAIALCAAAGVVLFSSRSVVLTIFATVTVGYVLTAVTATLVAMGWSLGFLESILFAILIGISCDFVIHFSHAYAHLKGHKTREERTLFALLSMGPSILAAAFTTFSAALVMLFTVITFFEKFAVVLFLTVIHALLGSFVVFLTMAVCLGPSDPTFLIDHIMAKCCPFFCGRDFEIQGDEEEEGEVVAAAEAESDDLNETEKVDKSVS